MLESLGNKVASFGKMFSGEKKNDQNAKKIKSEDKYDSNVVVDFKPEELGPISKEMSDMAPGEREAYRALRQERKILVEKDDIIPEEGEMEEVSRQLNTLRAHIQKEGIKYSDKSSHLRMENFRKEMIIKTEKSKAKRKKENKIKK